jgi:hypothetical protein
VLRDGVIVDGVLGTGCRGAPTARRNRRSLWINRMRPQCLSGRRRPAFRQDGDTCETARGGGAADVTVTLRAA